MSLQATLDRMSRDCICHEHRPRCTCVAEADIAHRRATYWKRVKPFFAAYRRHERYLAMLDRLAPGLGSYVRFFGLP